MKLKGKEGQKTNMVNRMKILNYLRAFNHLNREKVIYLGSKIWDCRKAWGILEYLLITVILFVVEVTGITSSPIRILFCFSQ